MLSQLLFFSNLFVSLLPQHGFVKPLNRGYADCVPARVAAWTQCPTVALPFPFCNAMWSLCAHRLHVLYLTYTASAGHHVLDAALSSQTLVSMPTTSDVNAVPSFFSKCSVDLNTYLKPI